MSAAVLAALRPHHWAKNLLLILPVAAAHRIADPRMAWLVLQGMASFSLLASAVYLTNDVLDAERDRTHPTKRHRAVASGRLRPRDAFAIAAALAAVALLLALRLPERFLWVWLAYLVASSAYSLGLKQRVGLDVILLASLYASRVVAGAAATSVPLTRWFLAFSVFLFFSLALVKRAAEAVAEQTRVGGASTAGGGGQLAGRGWRTTDVPVLLAFGTAAGVAAALVYCLYISGEDVVRLYARPDLLWAGLPVFLYWLTRVWILAFRGEVHADPLLFALRDAASWGCAATFVVLVWLAA
jgi:4-hydroxybenzoate polyprenyltransferase